MNVEFSQLVAAPPAQVFAALRDPAVLRRCIDGLESMTLLGDNTYELRAKGGLKGTVRLESVGPQDPMRVILEGRSFAGSLKASVLVHLIPREGTTEVRGTADVTVGGFLVALGTKIVETGARQAIADFFSRFSAQITSSGS